MSSWAGEIRRREAARRREERESRKRQKELARLIREGERLSERQKAQLEVEMHENEVEELLSVHKEQSQMVDWAKYAAALPPLEPFRSGRHEFAAVVSHGVVPLEIAADNGNVTAEAAKLLDDQEYQATCEDHARRFAGWMQLRSLAKRVLAGQSQAYSEAISEFSSLAEMSVLGSSIRVIVHSPRLIECVLMVNGREIIPAQAKSLLASGKLSVKAMPKLRFHEIYQDYVCGCVLRVAREMVALLPINEVLITASVDGIDHRSGERTGVPVLSVAITRTAIEQLDFERLDPSDSMENFVHRGDAKTSRKSGEFVPIVPLTPQDLAPTQPERMDFSRLLVKVREYRAEIGSKIIADAPAPNEAAPETLLIV